MENVDLILILLRNTFVKCRKERNLPTLIKIPNNFVKRGDYDDESEVARGM